MGWSYTKARATEYSSDGSYSASWNNAWTIKEVAPTQAGYIRLRLDIESYSFWSSSDTYNWYSTDTIAYGGETRTIHARSLVPTAATYSTYMQIPNSWAGKTVTLRVAWKTVSVQLNATGVTPSTVTAADGNFGHAIPITLTPSVSGVTHTVWTVCASQREELLTESSATSLSWVPAFATYLPHMANTGRATARIYCETFSNGTSRGTSYADITITLLPGELPPVLSSGWATAALLNQGAASGFNVWIQGYSKARVSFDTTKIAPQYGASIASITCEGETVTGNQHDTGVFGGTSASIVCTVTDSRGQTASETLSVTLLPYSPPTMTGSSAIRSDAQGQAAENGNYIAVQATAVFSSLNGTNSYTLTAYVRQLNGSFPSGGETFNSGEQQVLSTLYSPDTGYEVKLEITDGLGNTAAVTVVLPSRAWAMKFRPTGNGVAFGKAAEINSALELGPNWVLALHDGSGNTVTLSYADLVALKALLI